MAVAISDHQLPRTAPSLKYMQTPELEQDAVSPDVFSQTALELHKKTYHAAILDGKKLNAPSCFVASGVELFLVARYRRIAAYLSLGQWPL